MSADMMELQIAASSVKGHIPKDGTLQERIEAAMRYVNDPKNEPSIFWMTHSLNDDLKLRTALAAVLLGGNDKDRDIITRSLQPLRMLSAATSGIPVDFSALELSDDLLPLIKMFNESKASRP